MSKHGYHVNKHGAVKNSQNEQRSPKLGWPLLIESQKQEERAQQSKPGTKPAQNMETYYEI